MALFSIRSYRHRHRQTGFSTLELLMSLVVLAILTPMIVGSLNVANGFTQKRSNDTQSNLNQNIQAALLEYARTIDPTGQLPAPIQSGGVRYGVYNNDPNLATLLTHARVGLNQANSDGTAAANVRVYQRVTGLTLSTPMYAQSGPVVTLDYQLGALYSTTCARSMTCNTTGGPGGIPGVSGQITSANWTTFALTSPDYGLVMFSTLALQKQMLAVTGQRLDAIRDRMQEYFREKQRLAAANDTSNWYPLPTSGAMTAQGTADCKSPWYRLDADTNLLAQIGLTATEHGMTAWGGQIHFCNDFDVTGVKVAGAAPHFAALRFSNRPGNGPTLNPGTPDNSNNIVLAF